MTDAMSIEETSRAPIGARSNGAFDLAGLLARCMNDADMAASLIQRFTSRLPTAIRDMERLLAAGQCSQAASKAHTLKGEAGSLGAVELHAAVSPLEQALRGGDLGVAAGHWEGLKAAAEACLDARASALAELNQCAELDRRVQL